jgi:hypothetical protein
MGSHLEAESSRLLEGIALEDACRAGEVLAGCPTFSGVAGAPHYRASLLPASLLVVEEGLVVLRSMTQDMAHSIITCDAGPGRVLLPPSVCEVLCGLEDFRLTAITPEARDRLLRIPGAAAALLEQLDITLARNQEALGNFANTRHADRLRGKLLQLGRYYGRVVRDGIRIDFPVSHTVLAEMIGSSRETVTRALEELQQSGFAARRGHTYRLLVSAEDVLAVDSG